PAAVPQAGWADDGPSRSLGMSLDAVGPGTATVSMTLTDDMVNGHAIGHGGLTFTLSDSAFAVPCNSYNRSTVAAAAEIRFRRPTHLGDRLVATATERERAGPDGGDDALGAVGDQALRG